MVGQEGETRIVDWVGFKNDEWDELFCCGGLGTLKS